MNDKKKPSVVLNYIYNLAYQLLAVVLPVIVTPYVSRTLEVEGIGAYSYTLSIVSVFSIFGTLGLNTYGQLQISKVRNNKKKLNESFWGITIARVCASTVCIVIFLIFVNFQTHYKSLFYVLISMLIANMIDIAWFLQGIEEFKRIAIRNILIKLISVFLIFFCVKSRDDLLLYALVMQGSTLIGNFTLWFSVKKYINFISIKNINVFCHVKGSLVYFLPTISASVFTILDKSMLGAIVGSEYENGVYEQAHKIEQVVVTFVLAVNQVLLPRMSYLVSQNNFDEYKKKLIMALRFAGMLAFAMSFGLIGIAENFIPFFLGDGYGKSIILLQILSSLVFFSGMNTLIGNQCLVACGKQSKFNIGVIVGAVSNLLMNLILIPIMYSIGAAVASVMAEILIFITYLIFCRKSISFLKLLDIWKKYILAGFIMCVVVSKVGHYFHGGIITLVTQIIIGIIIYFGVLLITKDTSFIIILSDILEKIRKMGDKI